MSSKLNGLNHITLAVSDVRKSLQFYTELLGFTGHVRWDKGAYLSLDDIWLCLSLDSPIPAEDYTHIAWSIADNDFDDFSTKLKLAHVREWKTNSSEGKSLYILDPDGHKLEIHVGGLAQRLQSLKTAPYKGLVWL